MDQKIAEKDSIPSGNCLFVTPIKCMHDESQNKSTTANLDSSGRFTFEKLVQQHKLAVKYCSADLNDLLASDAKFKSPLNGLQLQATPAQKEWDSNCFFDIIEDFEDSASRFMSNKLNLELSVKKNMLAMPDDEELKQPVFSIPNSIGFNNPTRLGYSEDEYYAARHWGSRQHFIQGMAADGSFRQDDYRKRKRKNNAQLKILKTEFSKNDSWSKEKIAYVAQLTGLSESQVYKWCWDQKKKTEDQGKDQPESKGTFMEFDKFDSEFFLKNAIWELNRQDVAFKPEGENMPTSTLLCKRRPEQQSCQLNAKGQQ